MFVRKFAWTLIVASILFATGLASAEEPSPLISNGSGFSAERLENIDNYVKADISKGVIPGAVLVIVRHGKIVYQKVWGERDPATSVPMTADAIFRIYSMSKPIATVAAMMLVEEGRVGLQDPVSKIRRREGQP